MRHMEYKITSLVAEQARVYCTSIMLLCLVCVLIKSIQSDHSIKPVDLSCKKREYQLITDRRYYTFVGDHPLITIRMGIGENDRDVSPLLTEFWYEQIDQQSVVLQSSREGWKITGELNKDQNSSWDFQLGNQSYLTSNENSLLHIQSTFFHKQIHLLWQSKTCSYPNSSIDFSICCKLCSPSAAACPEVDILPEHSRYDLLVTNRGLMVKFSAGNFRCLLFPSEDIHRFWSTITHGMNVDQIANKDDFAIVQHSDGTVTSVFYYSIYPFHQWTKYEMDFNFIDVVFIPQKHWVIFELNECVNTLCTLSLRIHTYQLNKILKIDRRLVLPEKIIETNVSSSMSFRLYFHMLSDLLYLIGNRTIYASKSYGEIFTRIWTDEYSSSILNPIVFSDTSHMAFIYQLNNHSSCCQYFAVFSKAGLYYGWRTRIFRSSVQMTEPFFFDSSGSLYFQTIPPLLVILATEQTLVATSNLLVNPIPGRFFVRETDMDRFFVFCSLIPWDYQFELIGSTLRFDKLGLFFVITMDSPSTSWSFCLQTSRLDENSLQTSRACSLTLHALPITRKVHLQLTGCAFTSVDEYSTVIVEKFPNIFLDQIFNETSALGRIFQDTNFNDVQVNQWTMINIQNVEQILDRCLLKNLDENHNYPSFILLRPTTLYPFSNSDELVIKDSHFLLQNEYQFVGNNLYLLAPSFDNRKSIIHQEFFPSQLSCYLPVTRTITFMTKCLADMTIRPTFVLNSDLSKLNPISPPINYQLNRYQAGFPSVIVYNLATDQSICDGWKNCSCVSSVVSHDSIHCAEQFYTMNSTVNNRVYMNLSMGKESSYVPNNRSIFLIEEVSKRDDYELIDNLWTNEMKKRTLDLFSKHYDQLTDNEIETFRLLSIEENLFLGPELKLKLLDEGLYHFRLTYLWGDQFCLASTDFLFLVISNTATLPSYLFNYFLACIIILIFMLILWIIYVIFYEEIFPKYMRNFFRMKTPTSFTRRSIHENINFEILVKIREQSHRLLPYKDFIAKPIVRKDVLRQNINQLVHQLQNNSP